MKQTSFSWLTLGLTSVVVLSSYNIAAATPPVARMKQVSKTSRYIVQVRDNDALTRRTFRLALRGKVKRLGRTIAGMNCAVIEATPEQVKKLAADSRVVSVTPDRIIHGQTTPPLDIDRAALGTDQVNGTQGYTGTETGAGIGVAVIDSGIMGTHPDLLLRVAAFKDYVNGFDNTPYDDYGHGTHIAGLIGGSGASAVAGGASHNYRGVAPASHLVGLKVLDAFGVGRTSDVIAALDWCVANKTLYNLRVVNLSLSTTITGPAASDPLCQAAERAVNAGLVVVASAGNLGGIYGTVGAPGNDPKVITVGATNTMGTAARGDDTITSFTGRGPTPYDVLIKPDIIAPGNDIVSLRVPGATIDTMYPIQTRHSSAPDYARLSGTSMSTALVSGAAALMINANPALTPNAVKASLMFTAQVLSGYDPVTGLTTYYDPFVQGAGQLNVIGAVELVKRIQPGTGFTGTLPMTSLIAGQAAPWAGATIPAIMDRPGLTWGTSILWGGNTGLTIEDARIVWGSNVVWGGNGSDLGGTIPPRLWNDDLVYGNNVVWGGNGSDLGGTIPPRFAMVYGDNVVWGGNGSDLGGTIPPRFYDENATVNANNVVWGGNGSDLGGTIPPRIAGDEEGEFAAGDSQTWGDLIGLLLPDPICGPAQ
ncbi:MAG: S8 family peptidase [Fibrella sp.]|nr:S8 family peptidase [Armatimonadota bacterium]